MSKISAIAVGVVVVLIVAGFAIQRSFAADNGPMPEVGQSAPTFTLPNQEGTPVEPGQLQGKVGGAVFLSEGYDHGLHD
jgi:peroxiredoxin Q/BCP